MASIETLSALGSPDLLDTGELETAPGTSRAGTRGQRDVVDDGGPGLVGEGPSRAAEAVGPGRSVRVTATRRCESRWHPGLRPFQAWSARERVRWCTSPCRSSGTAVRAMCCARESSLRAWPDCSSAAACPRHQSAVLVDRKKVIVARSADGEQVLGKPATPELARRSDASVDGSFTDVSLDGVPVHAGFHRSGVSGWTVATSMPMALVNGPLWRRLGLLLVVGAVLIGLGMARGVVVRAANPRAHRRALERGRRTGAGWAGPIAAVLLDRRDRVTVAIDRTRRPPASRAGAGLAAGGGRAGRSARAVPRDAREHR